jgi:Protein tyrosine/serine phosphatase
VTSLSRRTRLDRSRSPGVHLLGASGVTFVAVNEGVTLSVPHRRITVGATANLRDIGDYPAGSTRTQWGRLFRSDAPRTVDGLTALGLRTVIDLRDDAELDAQPTGLHAIVPAVLHRPLRPRPLVTADVLGAPDRLAELYIGMLRHRGPQLARIVTDLARPGALPALVHCAAGKDRTGVVVALVLSAIGVPDDVVVADYALTGDHLTPAFFATLPAASAATDEGVETLRGARPESMAAMLRFLADEHRGARAYLIRHGTPAEAIEHLRTALTH